MSKKSPEAYRTISEVAETLDIQPHVLRFWETKFTKVKPLKRRGGRRYYSSKDIDLLRKIRDLLYNDGYTIKGVQKLMHKRYITDADAVLVQDNLKPEQRHSREADTPTSENATSQVAATPRTETSVMGAPTSTDPNTPQEDAYSKAMGFDFIVRQEIELAIQELEEMKAELTLSSQMPKKSSTKQAG